MLSSREEIMATVGPVTTEGLNLQARFEQLEGAISEAHSIVSQMLPREEKAESPVAGAEGSATFTATRCQESLSELITRLQNLRDKVGLV